MNSCLQVVSHVKHVAQVLRDPTCSSFVVGMLRRVSKGARITTTCMQTFVNRCTKEFRMQRDDGDQYDAKECFDSVFCSDHCPALQEVFQCVTLPGVTCRACKNEFYDQLVPNNGFELPLHAGQNVQQLVESALAPSSVQRMCQCGYSGQTLQHDTIMKYPKVMVLQLLRFDRLRKICSVNDHHLVARLHVGDCHYNLSGVIEHVGNNRHSGHYISYELCDGVWYKSSDMSVSIVTEADVLQVQAYVCLYADDDVLPDNALMDVSQPNASEDEVGKANSAVRNRTPQLTCDMDTSEGWVVPRKRVHVSGLQHGPMLEAHTSKFEVLRPADDEVGPDEKHGHADTNMRRCEPRARKRKHARKHNSRAQNSHAQNSHARAHVSSWVPEWVRIATREIVEKCLKRKHTVEHITQRVMKELALAENMHCHIRSFVTNTVTKLSKYYERVKPGVDTQSPSSSGNTEPDVEGLFHTALRHVHIGNVTLAEQSQVLYDHIKEHCSLSKGQVYKKLRHMDFNTCHLGQFLGNSVKMTASGRVSQPSRRFPAESMCGHQGSEHLAPCGKRKAPSPNQGFSESTAGAKQHKSGTVPCSETCHNMRCASPSKCSSDVSINERMANMREENPSRPTMFAEAQTPVLENKCADMVADPAIGAAPNNTHRSGNKSSATVRMDPCLRFRIINLLVHIQEREPQGGQQMNAEHYTAKVMQELGEGVNTTTRQVKRVVVRHFSGDHPKLQGGNNPKIRGAESLDEGVAKYQQLISQVPNAECSCCNQTWFPTSISSANDSTLAKISEKLTSVLKHDVDGNIINRFCSTCLANMREGKVPAQSALTGVRFPDLPVCLAGLNELEQRLVAVRQCFGQIIGLRSGGQRCLKGSVINVPAKLHQVQTHLPRFYSETDTIACQLVRRMAFKSYYLQSNIRPERIKDAITYLATTPLYVKENVVVRKDWKYICEDDRLALQCEEEAVNDAIMQGTGDTQTTECAEVTCESPVEDGSEHEAGACAGDAVTFLDDGVTAELTRDRVLRFAPSENEVPKSLVLDEFAEELAYPCVFGGYPRTKSNLTYTKINAWELRSIDPRVARHPDILFFKLKKSEAMRIMSCANVRMRKGNAKGHTYTVKDVRTEEKRSCLIEQDLGYRDLNRIRSSDDHLETSRKDILAMLRQLGVPSLFVTFTAADTHWVEVLKMLSKTVHNKDLTDEEIEGLSWEQRAELIRKDPVTTARYYKHRMDALFNFMVKHAPHLFGGKLEHHCYVEEFQKRGTPHRHALFWIEGAPTYTGNNDAEFVAYYSSMMSTACDGLPPDLCVAQRHRCTSAYCMSKHKVCRFGAPWCPVPATCLVKPFAEDEDPPDGMSMADLKKVYERIRGKLVELDTVLKKQRDPKEPERIAICNMSFQDFLAMCEVKEDMYMHALRTAIKREVLLCKREVRDMRINTYHPILLPLTCANMDIQPVINAYAAVMYVTSYLVKGDSRLSKLLRETKAACDAGGVSVGQRVRKVGNILMNSTEISAQQAVFLLLGMPLKHQSSATVWVPTTPCGERTFMLKSVEALAMLADGSTDIACNSNVDYFVMYHKARTAAGNLPAEHGWPDLCLADFATWYEPIITKCDLADADYRSSDEVVSAQFLRLCFPQPAPPSWDTTTSPRTKPKTYRRRTTQKILRHMQYDIVRDPANHFREKLLLFLPGSHWVPYMSAKCNEDEALLLNCTSYLDAYERHVDVLMERNRAYVFNFSIDWDALQQSVLQDCEEARQRLNEIARTQEHSHEGAGTCVYDVGVDIREPGMPTGTGGAALQQQTNKMATDDYFRAVDSLNAQQRALFKHIMHTVKHAPKQPFHIFLTGGAGVGKSVLLRCLVQALMRWYDSQPGAELDHSKVLVMAYTGTAAFNVGGNTIHGTMRFSLGTGSGPTPQLDSQRLQSMRTQFLKMQVVVIDEISLVNSNIMGHIDSRLRTVMGCLHTPFGGLSLLVVGDLFQLPPVGGKWIFQSPSTGVGGLAEGTWGLFTMYELKDIMRQKHKDFAERVNRLRDWDVCAPTKQADEEWWNNKARTSNSPPPGTPHLFFTNRMCNTHNAAVLRDMEALSVVKKREPPTACCTVRELRVHQMKFKRPVDLYVQKLHCDPAQTYNTTYGSCSDRNGDGIGIAITAAAVVTDFGEGVLLGCMCSLRSIAFLTMICQYSRYVPGHVGKYATISNFKVVDGPSYMNKNDFAYHFSAMDETKLIIVDDCTVRKPAEPFGTLWTPTLKPHSFKVRMSR